MASTADLSHMSPALQEYFKLETAAAAQERSAAEVKDGADLQLDDLDITTAQISLAGVEDQLDHFANHDVLKAILDQGCDPKEYGQQYETKLRQAELESIQDYITESDNLVELHDQVHHHSVALACLLPTACYKSCPQYLHISTLCISLGGPFQIASHAQQTCLQQPNGDCSNLVNFARNSTPQWVSQHCQRLLLG